MITGLFFGSFNPIHIGHLIVANVMVEATDIDKVWFVVSPQNPFKKGETILDEFDRMNMVRVATHDNDRFEACDVELNMPKPSYTVDTLAYLMDKYPDKSFKIILGEDNLIHFRKWKHYEQVLRHGIYVYPRPHAQKVNLHNHSKVSMIKSPMIDISATFIRQCIQKNQSIKYLVPDGVQELISSKGYYL